MITSETRLHPTDTVRRKAQEIGVSLDDVLNVVRQRDPTTWPGRALNQLWYQGDKCAGGTPDTAVRPCGYRQRMPLARGVKNGFQHGYQLR